MSRSPDKDEAFLTVWYSHGRLPLAILPASADGTPPFPVLGPYPPGHCTGALLPAAARGILVLGHRLSGSARSHHLHRRRDRPRPRPAATLVRRIRTPQADSNPRGSGPAESGVGQLRGARRSVSG